MLCIRADGKEILSIKVAAGLEAEKMKTFEGVLNYTNSKTSLHSSR